MPVKIPLVASKEGDPKSATFLTRSEIDWFFSLDRDSGIKMLHDHRADISQINQVLENARAQLVEAGVVTYLSLEENARIALGDKNDWVIENMDQVHDHEVGEHASAALEFLQRNDIDGVDMRLGYIDYLDVEKPQDVSRDLLLGDSNGDLQRVQPFLQIDGLYQALSRKAKGDSRMIRNLWLQFQHYMLKSIKNPSEYDNKYIQAYEKALDETEDSTFIGRIKKFGRWLLR